MMGLPLLLTFLLPKMTEGMDKEQLEVGVSLKRVAVCLLCSNSVTEIIRRNERLLEFVYLCACVCVRVCDGERQRRTLGCVCGHNESDLASSLKDAAILFSCDFYYFSTIRLHFTAPALTHFFSVIMNAFDPQPHNYLP